MDQFLMTSYSLKAIHFIIGKQQVFWDCGFKIVPGHNHFL
jgi:hypothetical protein